MESEATDEPMAATAAQVHYFYEDVSAEHHVLFLEGKVNAVTGEALYDIAFWVLVELLVVVRIEELRLQPERVLDLRQVFDYEVLESDAPWASHSPRKDLVEVEDVSELRGLGHAATMAEPLPPVVGDCALRIICKSAKQQIAAYKCASPSFASITVNVYHIFRVSFKKVVNCLASFRQQGHCWAVMVLPAVIINSPLEWSFVVRSATQVIDPKFVPMFLLDESGHIVYRVSVHLLKEV